MGSCAIKEVEGSVCAPKGYVACGVSCGLKKSGEDIAIIYAETPARVAGTFTTNRVKAAPVRVTMEAVRGGIMQAVVVNSGNANACNGDAGMRDAIAMAEMSAKELRIPTEWVGVSSTGVIGVPLPMDRIARGIKLAASGLSPTGNGSAARAIMTTDTFPKEMAIEVALGEYAFRVGAIAKGSGMIHPNMATMLCFITTDALVSPRVLEDSLRECVDESFNMITVDGDTSTNDMVLLLANGLAGNPEILPGTPEERLFREALRALCVNMAKTLVKDGEGATKVVEVRVRGACDRREARFAARAIAGSNLVKAALFGCDANWGRIICALGYSGASFREEEVMLRIGHLAVVEKGHGVPFDEEEAKEVLSRDFVQVEVEIGDGPGEAVAWGCDLTYEYVRINAAYRS